MTNLIQKQKAITLRKKGLSIGEISKKLGKQKSTVSYWCRGILLTKSQTNKLLEKSISSGIKAGIKISKESKIKRDKLDVKLKNQGLRDIGKISDRDLFLLGIGLYWGEGYKKGNYEFGFTNSDPFIIKSILKFLNKFYSVDSKSLILRVSINSTHKQRENEVINFWSKQTKTNHQQFTKTSFIKTPNKKTYANNDNYFGTLRVKVRKGSNIRRRILGSIEGVKNQI